MSKRGLTPLYHYTTAIYVNDRPTTQFYLPVAISSGKLHLIKLEMFASIS